MDKAVDVNVLKFKGWTIPFTFYVLGYRSINPERSGFPSCGWGAPVDGEMPFMEIKNK